MGGDRHTPTMDRLAFSFPHRRGGNPVNEEETQWTPTIPSPHLSAGPFGPRARAAQDASPAAGAGPSLETLAHGIPTIAPGQDLGLVRITFPPGSTVPTHTHPGAMAFWVETGAVGWTPIGPDIQVMRAATAGTPGPTETVSAGTEAVLRAGEALFVAEPHGEVLVRNAGEGTAVALAAYLFAADQPFITFTNEQGTPPAGTPES